MPINSQTEKSKNEYGTIMKNQTSENKIQKVNNRDLNMRKVNWFLIKNLTLELQITDCTPTKRKKLIRNKFKRG